MNFISTKITIFQSGRFCNSALILQSVFKPLQIIHVSIHLNPDGLSIILQYSMQPNDPVPPKD